MNLQQGTLLKHGEYRIERELGHGGFGITYLAVQLGLNRKVAIKEFFMSEYCNRDAETSHVTVGSEGSKELVAKFRTKFIKEAQNIAGLKHPHIISIHDVFEDNGTAYYVMEYLEHGSLADMVKRQGRLAEADALRYIRQIAYALRYIHARNMNHLDVKPGNILIDETDHAVLIDFGLSKRYDDEGNQTSTTPVGISHGYAPLEQYKKSGVGTFSPATDIYSLGATLYKLVTGTTPPDANDVNDDGLPSFPAYVSATTAKAIEQAMQPRRKDRPQSVDAFLSLLDAEAKAEDERTVMLDEKEPKSEEAPAAQDEVSRPSTAYTDRPVGFWPLVPVVAFGLDYLVDLSLLPWWVYPFSTCIYIVSAIITFAKIVKGGSRMNMICFYVWACSSLFVCFVNNLEGFCGLPYYVMEAGVVRGAIALIDEILLPVFLVITFIRTSTYKIPLIVGFLGSLFDIAHSLSFSILPSSIRQETLYAHALLMAVSFLMIFFASRKLEKTTTG